MRCYYLGFTKCVVSIELYLVGTYLLTLFMSYLPDIFKYISVTVTSNSISNKLYQRLSQEIKKIIHRIVERYINSV